MISLLRIALLFLTLAGIPIAPGLAAEAILPPAQGKHSVTFVLPDTVAPLETGARIEFVSTTEKDVPRRLKIFGLVLGMRDSVVFVEVSEKDAVWLAHARQSAELRLAKVGEPDESVIAERRKLGAAEEAVQIAPTMRLFKVRVSSEQKGADTWQRGDLLVFRETLRQPNYRIVEGQFLKSGPARAIVLAVEPVSGGYELSLLSDPSDAPEIIMADVEGRLTLEREGETQAANTIERERCYIRQRHGEGVISVEIPCSD